MEEKKRISLFTYVVTLIIMAIICIGLIIALIINSQKKDIQNNNDESIIAEEDKSEEELDIIQVLTNENLITTAKEIGAGYPSGYYFSEDGKFAYSIGENQPTKQGQTLSIRGTWSLNNKKLILNAEEIQKAVGGELVPADGVNEEHIEGYTEQVSKFNSTKEYIIKSYQRTEDEEYIELENENLYPLTIDEEYIGCLKALAINGYEEYEKRLQTYNAGPEDKNQYIDMTEENYKKYNNDKYRFIMQRAANDGNGIVTIKGQVYEIISEQTLPKLSKEQYDGLLNGGKVTIFGNEFAKNDFREEEAKEENYDMILGETDVLDTAYFFVKKNNDGTANLAYYSEGQIGKKTDIYMKISLDENMNVESYGETTTLKNKYKKPYYSESDSMLEWMPIINDIFTFENGKCTSVVFGGT